MTDQTRAAIRHVIWDWNGTLLDDAQACVDALNLLLTRRNLPTVSRAQYREVFGFPIRDYYLKVGFDFARDDWNAMTEEYHTIYAELSRTSQLRPHAHRILDGLRKRGCGLSVLSACEAVMLKRMIEERGILDCFDHVYGRSDFQAHSKVDLGRTLLGDTSIAPESALLVGDTTHDFEVAQALGTRCILMTGGHQSETRLLRCGCPVAHTLHEVVAWLEG